MENNDNFIVLQNKIEIPTYEFDDVNKKFDIIKTNTFKINYIYVQKGLLNVVVNNYRTSKFIDLHNNRTQPFKKTILKAISEYIEMINSVFIDESEFYVQSDKSFVRFEHLVSNEFYKHIINNHLLTITKEYTRDVLSKNNLINL